MALYSWRRWKGPEQKIALGLFGWRMIGFVAFELTGARWLLLVFPNLFMWWWVFVAGRDRFKPEWEITTRRAVIVLAVLLVPNMLSEMILHFWQLHPVTITVAFFKDLFGKWRGSHAFHVPWPVGLFPDCDGLWRADINLVVPDVADEQHALRMESHACGAFELVRLLSDASPTRREIHHPRQTSGVPYANREYEHTGQPLVL